MSPDTGDGGFVLRCEINPGYTAEGRRQNVERYREAAEEARRAMDAQLRAVVPAVALRDVERLREAEKDSLRVLIAAEMLAGIMEDPDALTSWLHECVSSGEIVGRTPAEDAW